MEEESAPLYIACPCHFGMPPDSCRIPCFWSHSADSCPRGKTTSFIERSSFITGNLNIVCSACDKQSHIKNTQFLCIKANKFKSTTSASFTNVLRCLAQIMVDSEDESALDFLCYLKKKLIREKW